MAGRKLRRAGILFFLAAALAAAQSTSPAFTAVNLAPSGPGIAGGRGAAFMFGGAAAMTSGRLYYPRTSLVQLIAAAYGLDRQDRVVGGPAWLSSDLFDLRATASPSTTPQQMQTMLQDLLAERFGLKVHMDNRSFPGYALALGKGKPKLKPTAGGDPSCREAINAPSASDPAASPTSAISLENATLRAMCTNQTMDAFLQLVQGFLTTSGQPPPVVVNNTGLTDAYDFELDVDASVVLSRQGDSSALITKLLENQLGLSLEPHPTTLAVVVVDSANEKISTPAGAAPPLPPPPAEFDVASIKAADPNANPPMRMAARGGGMVIIAGGRGGMAVPQVTPGGEVQCVASLQGMILFAYDMTPDRLATPPAWLDQDKWTIVARTSPGLISDDTKGMMQKLLEQRFGLAVHRDTRTVDAYVMTPSGRKVTLKPASAGERSECQRSNENGAQVMTCTATTMAQLADQLPNVAPVYFQQHHAVDQTEYPGAYDFTIRWAPQAALQNAQGGGANGQAADPSQMSITSTIFEAVDKTLGVKVALAKAPMSVLVIDHIDRTPTAN